MSQEAVAVLEKFYVAERRYVAAGGSGKADFGEVAQYLDPGIVLYSAPGLPYGGTWRGHDGMERFLGAMSDAWESMEFLEQRQVVDDGQVAMFLRVRFCARGSGRELETTLLQLNTVRDGLVTEFRPYYFDPAAVTEVLSA
ncbi:nuclear transport factor 2 family protein [Amycolatopsis nigrescens]|uniref:nuclear transport factor 2 family protein n=1 Tax=Amycolatopsis nigrescens TaxID=381445 RepID=UPI00039C3CCE|nr:nuclear transport factor 2 family protein [Amycolatopsis nigrescens]